MGLKYTSKDWMLDLQHQFSNVIHSEPTVQIKLKSTRSGQYRFEWVNKDCWRDEVFRRGFYLFCAEKGFEAVENPSHAQESASSPTAGLWIDHKSGKVADTVSSDSVVD